MHLSQIFIYPIKSLGGIELNEAEVEERGLRYDRRWLLIDPENRFVSQRENYDMAFIDVKLSESGLEVQHRQKPDLGVLTVSYIPQTSQILNVTVWDDTTKAVVVSDVCNRWFSEALNMNLRLVYMPDSAIRLADANYAPFENNVSFADAYPILIIGKSSLDDLNSRLDIPVEMLRFRPNFVVEGSEPFEEDSWRDFEIGGVSMVGVKPCARCVLTTIDPQTAQKGKEPLKTLATYRQRNNKIYFGQNVISRMHGTVKVGDNLRIFD